MSDTKDLTRSDTLFSERILQVRVDELGEQPANQLELAGRSNPKRRLLSVRTAFGRHISLKPSQVSDVVAGASFTLAIAAGGWMLVAPDSFAARMLMALAVVGIWMSFRLASRLAKAKDAAGRGVSPGLRKCKAKRISKTQPQGEKQ